MEERHLSEKPAPLTAGREKMRVAREELIAGIPPVRVVERIRLEVPAAVVPVAVDRPQNALHAYATPSMTPLRATIPRILLELNLMRDLKVRQHSVPILIFFERQYPHSQRACSL